MTKREPTQFFILGGGGDLAQRKLFPALFDLYINKLLPEQFEIVGLARTARTDAEYQSLIQEALMRMKRVPDAKHVADFCSHARYVSGSFEDAESFTLLKEAVTSFNEKAEREGNRVFYLAVPPAHYASIFALLSESGIAKNTSNSWARMLIEKPFGHDKASAEALDASLSGLFSEDQIFRIDHYLAKEAVQNLLAFRFANTIVRNSWNKDHIHAVHIAMHESLDVSNRGAFYDKVGALKDVGQNHLLQLLALIAMDEPEVFDAAHIRKGRAEILKKLLPVADQTHIVRAQYEGYKETPGVAPDSQTETYFSFRAFIDHTNWEGVPFYVQAGKGLKNDSVSITIDFKDVTKGPFSSSGNAIILTVSPVQSMNLTVNVKKPGHAFSIEEQTLSFAWDEDHQGVANAYEKVLLDCIDGDQTLFASTSEVLSSWEFIRSITEGWGSIPLLSYQQGSDGPLLTEEKS